MNEHIAIPTNDITNSPKFHKLINDIEEGRIKRDNLTIKLSSSEDNKDIVECLTNSTFHINQLIQIIHYLSVELEEANKIAH